MALESQMVYENHRNKSKIPHKREDALKRRILCPKYEKQKKL